MSRGSAQTAGAVSGFVLDRGAAAEVQPVTLGPHDDLFFRLLWGCNLSPGTTLLCRRACFEEIGFFDETMRRLEDWDWLLRYARKFDLAIVGEPLAIVHVGAPPPTAPVSDALATIEQRYEATADRLGPKAARIFRSSLTLERAAIAFRERKLDAAVRLVFKSLRAYPGRDLRFFLRMAQHLLAGLGRRLAPAARARAAAGPASVLHVITTLRTGGAENMLVQLAERDQAMGRRQWIATLQPGAMNMERLARAKVPVTVLDVEAPTGVLRGFVRLVRLIRRERPEVVVGWMYHANLLATLALYCSGRLYRTRLIWGLRNSQMDFQRYRRRLRLVVRLSALLSRLPDAVVANSQAGFEFHRRTGFRPNRYYIVDNGVDPARFAADPARRAELRAALGVAVDACVAVMVARVDPMKDYDNLLAALHRVEGLVTLVAGRDTQTLPDAPGLVKLGHRRDIPLLLAASDILVLSSAFGEGVPNVVLEGMAAGLAVVATDVGDTRRVLGSTGLVVPPRDAAALADAVRRVAGDPGLRRRLGEAARLRAAHRFSIAQAVETFGTLLDRPDAPAFRWSAVPLTPAAIRTSARE